MQPEQQPIQPQVQPPQWQFVADDGQQQPQQQAGHDSQSSNVSWSASEFIAYQKSAGWYLLIVVVIVALAALILVLTRDLVSMVSTILIGILFIAFAARKPRVLTYQITKDGIMVGEKLYSFSTLKSFAVIDEGTLHSIMLIPTQRFLPAISIYFDPQEERQIVETLGGYLPHEDRKQDFIDRFMHKIRF